MVYDGVGSGDPDIVRSDKNDLCIYVFVIVCTPRRCDPAYRLNKPREYFR